jgi:hypothetical protein
LSGRLGRKAIPACRERRGAPAQSGRRASREPLVLRDCKVPKDFKGQREIPAPSDHQGLRASGEPMALWACRVSKDLKDRREIPAPPDRRVQRATPGPEALAGRRGSKATSASPGRPALKGCVVWRDQRARKVPRAPALRDRRDPRDREGLLDLRGRQGRPWM